MPSEVGQRLKEIRTAKGISQYRLSKLSGISQSAISTIESSTKSPTTDTLERLAEVLGCTVAELMGETVETRRPTDAEIKFALFGGDQEITDAQFEEVKRFAQYVKERESRDKR